MRVVGLPSAFYYVGRHSPLSLTAEAKERLRYLSCWQALRKRGVSSTQASQELGLPISTLYRWHPSARGRTEGKRPPGAGGPQPGNRHHSDGFPGHPPYKDALPTESLAGGRVLPGKDGGSEFQALFEEECQKRGPSTPLPQTQRPCGEGPQDLHRGGLRLSSDAVFYEMYDGELEITALNQALVAWEGVYNTVRPHQALDWRTPQEYLTQCHPELALQGQLSHM